MADDPSGNRYSSDTPVTDMGLGPAQTEQLSAAGKALTKDDLVKLWGNQLNDRLKAATLGDIDVIKSAFQPVIADASGESGDTSCCCTPCCCAAAVMKPLAETA